MKRKNIEVGMRVFVKENLKIETPNKRDNAEAIKLFRDLGYPSLFADEMFVYATSSVSNTLRIISFDELRELARPKEYLNEKFELVVTNQPDDGWILVPDGANFATSFKNTCYKLLFWTHENECFNYYNELTTNNLSGVLGWSDEILWQRENRVDTVKGREGNAGRFLHQWAYEAFGRGEDVQFKLTNHSDNQWKTLSTHSTFEKFNENQYEFRIKPKTIQIGSRTITKPIGVKPEMGTVIYVSSATQDEKYISISWDNSLFHLSWLNRNLCHLTKEDAINMTDALLELLK